MLSLMLTWIILSLGYAGGFLDLDELKNVYYGIDISDTPLLHPSVWNEISLFMSTVSSYILSGTCVVYGSNPFQYNWTV